MDEDRTDATIAEVAAAVRRDMAASPEEWPPPDDAVPGEPSPEDAEVLAVVYRWFDAWNARDPEAVAASLAERGAFVEPSTDGPLREADLADHVRALVTRFPDLSFDLLAESVTAPNTVMA